MPEIFLDFVEVDENYVTVTAGDGVIHYIDNFMIDKSLLRDMKNNKIAMGESILIDLSDKYIQQNGVIECL